METESLIKTLAADSTPPQTPHLRARVALGALVSVALMAAFWGPRADWAEAMRTLPVAFKQLLPVCLALITGYSMFRPVEKGPRPVLWAGLLALGCTVAWALAMRAGGDLWGRTWWDCLLSIPALALPIGLLLFGGLRHRIELDGARSGLVAGLFAGALSASVYAIHCDDDGPAFFLLWYSLSILLCGVAGRVAGKRWLHA